MTPAVLGFPACPTLINRPLPEGRLGRSALVIPVGARDCFALTSRVGEVDAVHPPRRLSINRPHARAGAALGGLLLAAPATLAALAAVGPLTPRRLRPLPRSARPAGPTRRGAVAASVLALGLSSCAFPTREAFDAQMAAFVGRSEAELVAALGVPDRTHEAGGMRFLEYERRRVVGTPTGTAGFGRFGRPWGYGFGYGGTFVDTRECDTTFTLRGGRVERFSRRGNDCRAYPGELPP